MTSHSMLGAALLSALGCATDLRTRRIPNALTAGGAICACAYHLTTAGWSGLGHALGGLVVGLAVFLMPFALGGLGGGDVKLVAALGAWLGPSDALWLALYTALSGGVLALGVAMQHHYLTEALRNIRTLWSHWRQHGPVPCDGVTLEDSVAPRVAYGLAIAMGTAGVVWLR